jgi:hypothetical protein
MLSLSGLGPLVSYTSLFIWLLTILHCTGLRQFRHTLRPWVPRLTWFVALVAGAGLPQPLQVTEGTMNGRAIRQPNHYERGISGLPPGAVVHHAGAHSSWQFYHSDRASIDAADGTPLVRMESHTIVVPVWLFVGVLAYWFSAVLSRYRDKSQDSPQLHSRRS